MSDPIRHMVVLGHPSPSSFNHAIAATYCRTVRECGQEATLDDLYARGFDPVLRAEEFPGNNFHVSLDVADELEMLRDATVIALVYPIWFGLPPAIIKGYVDRVLGAGVTADAITSDRPSPLLKGKRMMILSSSASTRPWLEERGQWESLRQAFDRYLVDAFGLLSCDHIHFDAVVPGLSQRTIEEKKTEASEAVRKLCSTVLAERHARENAERLKSQGRTRPLSAT